MSEDLDRDVTIPEAAELFGIDRTALYRWHRQRKLTAVAMLKGPGRTGRVPVFRLSEVARIVADRHAENTESHANEDTCPPVVAK